MDSGQCVGSSGCPAAVALAARDKARLSKLRPALPGILLNARNQRTKAGGGRGCQKEARTTKSRRETSKDTKAFAKNGAKTNYFWTRKILTVDVSSERDMD